MSILGHLSVPPLPIELLDRHVENGYTFICIEVIYMRYDILVTKLFTLYTLCDL